MLARQSLDLLVIDQAGAGIHAVLHGVEQLAGEIHFGAVRQVAAVIKAHAENGVPGESSARYTAALACEPECGCTLA